MYVIIPTEVATLKSCRHLVCSHQASSLAPKTAKSWHYFTMIKFYDFESSAAIGALRPRDLPSTKKLRVDGRRYGVVNHKIIAFPCRLLQEKRPKMAAILTNQAATISQLWNFVAMLSGVAGFGKVWKHLVTWVTWRAWFQLVDQSTLGLPWYPCSSKMMWT